jgi:hypothetical protein
MGPVRAVSGALLAGVRSATQEFLDKLAVNFLFGGSVKEAHKTKFAIDKIVQRHSESIISLNRAVVTSVAFVPIAILVTGSDVKIPMLDITVKFQDWLRLCPAISFGIQLFVLIAVFWFLILRNGLNILFREIGDVEYFGDISNFMLSGVTSILWIFIAIPAYLPNKLHLLWLLPFALLFILVLLSPSILCVYFVFELFRTGDLLFAIFYTLCLIPSIGLAVILIGLSLLAGFQDWFEAEFAKLTD